MRKRLVTYLLLECGTCAARSWESIDAWWPTKPRANGLVRRCLSVGCLGHRGPLRGMDAKPILVAGRPQRFRLEQASV